MELVNTTNTPLANATITADVFSLDNKSLIHQQAPQNAAADATTTAFHLDLAPLLQNGVVLVSLQLKSASGETLSRNLYWLAGKSEDYRALDKIPAANVTATASILKKENGGKENGGRDNGEERITVQLRNNGATVALTNKLTLVKAGDGRGFFLRTTRTTMSRCFRARQRGRDPLSGSCGRRKQTGAYAAGLESGLGGGSRFGRELAGQRGTPPPRCTIPISCKDLIPGHLRASCDVKI